MFRKLITLLILSLSCAGLAYGQSGYRYRYWFDTDDGAAIEGFSPSADIHLDADISRLDESLHTISIQVGDSTGWSAPSSRYFIKTSNADKPMLTYYWLDEYDNKREQLPTSASKMEIDVAAVPDGFHILHFQAVSSMASAPISRMFIKTPQTERIGEMTCLCSVDGKPFKQDKVPTNGGIVNWELDVSRLDQGMHQIQVQVLSPSGAASDVYNSFFFRTTKPAEINDMKFIYNVDGGSFKEGIGSGSNGVFHFDVDVSSLSDGLHSLHYMLIGDNGNSTVAKTSYFVKTPVGGDGIDSYRYWLNSNTAGTTTVKLDKRTSPYSLVKLLPVTSEPIRSECFHFEMADGVTPTIYAKNDIHFQFIDATTRVAEVHKQYIDYNVSKKVADTTPLAATQTFERPEENGIKWFTFEAEKGDTVAFRSSQATSLQVYAPSGKELYSASADKSITFGGCHTWESGLHYVAVHDVTGSRSNVTLDYMHMDKYDVVDQDVRVVGNGGASTITFKGNGFNNLYAVDFINSSNDTIPAINITHITDAELSVTTDFSAARLGYYNAIFHFTEDVKEISSSILMEEPKDITLSSKVTYQPTFLKSSGKTIYTVSIENKGNMTSYKTPIYIYVSSKNPSDISKIELDGLDLPKIYDYIRTDSLTSADWKWLKGIQDKIGDSHYFIGGMKKNEGSNDSIYACSNYFFTNIAPLKNKTFTITVYTTSPVEVWVTTANTNIALTDFSNHRVESFNKRTKSAKDSYCCVKERIECIASITSDIATIANFIGENTATAIADCVASTLDATISWAGTIMCDDKNAEKNFWDKVNDRVNSTSIIGTISSCASKFLPMKQWTALKKALDRIGSVTGNSSFAFGLGINHANCIRAFLEQKPNCPPIPPGGGGSNPVNSMDPNDIYGYLSEAGSKFISDSVQNVNYRIEFENDTAFATASAHVVEIRNKLDSRHFDLKSFAPTSIKIGDKVELLDGKPNFVKTIDMRPDIDAIVQVEGKYNSSDGTATWLLTSLDPITMEPTDEVVQGFLPINFDGTSGIGEVAYDIALKKGLADGTEIPNRASIIFDSNDPIETPTWINVVDAIAPESKISEVTQKNDSTVTISFGGSDARSGIW